MKKNLSLLLALLMTLSLCACGAGSKSASYEEYAMEAPAAAYMSADMAAEDAGYGGFAVAGMGLGFIPARTRRCRACSRCPSGRSAPRGCPAR